MTEKSMRTERPKEWANLSRFNHRRRYKCLESSFDGWHEPWKREAVLELAEDEGHDLIEPVFGVEGRYYDRYTRRAWEEYVLEDGTLIACLDSSHQGERPGFRREYFLYSLEQENHRPLSDRAIRALSVLSSDGLLNRGLVELLNRDHQWKHVERIKRDTAISVSRVRDRFQD